MRRIALALAGSLALATAAPAANYTFVDTFDGESDRSIVYYDAYANWQIQHGFTVLYGGTEATECAGGTGACVSFSNRNGTGIQSRETFTARAGQRITLEWDAVRHNGSGGVAFSFVDPVAGHDVWIGGAFGGYPGGDFAPSDGLSIGLGLGNDTQYLTYSLAYSVLTDAAFRLEFAGNTGFILDNVRLTVTDVPEPASWAMMAGGFGLIGGAMRRRRRASDIRRFA